MTKVEMLPLMPMRMLTLVRTTYAVLGILKKKEAGYIKGVMDQLETEEGHVRGPGVQLSTVVKCSTKQHTTLYTLLVYSCINSIYLFGCYMALFTGQVTGERMRERGGVTCSKGPKARLKPRAAAARTKPLYMGHCSTNWA